MTKVLINFILLIFMWIMILVVVGRGPSMVQSVFTLFCLAILAVVFSCLMEKE